MGERETTPTSSLGPTLEKKTDPHHDPQVITDGLELCRFSYTFRASHLAHARMSQAIRIGTHGVIWSKYVKLIKMYVIFYCDHFV